MRAATFTFALLVLMATWALVVPATRAQTGSIVLSVDCFATPETTRITNNTDQPLDLSRFTLTSLNDPRPNEPFTLSGTLQPGESATFTSGQGATGNVLTEQFIYDNEAPDEGAGLSTPFGLLTVRCRPGSGSLVLARGVGVPAAGGGLAAGHDPAASWFAVAGLGGIGLALVSGGLMLRRRSR